LARKDGWISGRVPGAAELQFHPLEVRGYGIIVFQNK
jgi:hypothetical protein